MRVPVLGHELIDRQHRRIAGLVRQLGEAAVRGRPCRGLLGRLKRETARHFASEERLMAVRSYPEAAGHRALHRVVLAEMQGMRELLLRRQPLHRKHATQIAAWLDHHVGEADRNLVLFLGGSGRRRNGG